MIVETKGRLAIIVMHLYELFKNSKSQRMLLKQHKHIQCEAPINKKDPIQRNSVVRFRFLETKQLSDRCRSKSRGSMGGDPDARRITLGKLPI